MRARNIKPGFYKDEKLVECSAWARLLAPGLWMLADKEGRLADKPKQIKMEVFPADSVDVEPLLRELHTHKHILRYEMNGLKYIQVLGFSEHQSPHYSEKISMIPAPVREDSGTSPPSSTGDSGKEVPSSSDIPKPKPKTPEPQPPDLLNPDSPTEDSPNVAANAASAHPPEKPKPKTAKAYTPAFDNFWSIYPRRDGSKYKAFEIFQRLTKEGICHDILIDGARKYAEHHARSATPPDKLAHATTWLNGRRWEAEYPTHVANPERGSKTSESLAALHAAGNRNGTGGPVESDPVRRDDFDLGYPAAAIAGGA